MLVRSLIAALLVALPATALAQAGGTAHLYAYRVKDHAAFERGYRRHLRWHARHADKLAWFAWYVTSGDRAGTFVDGTFGTTPEGLAGRPDPEGDGADFRANAGPYVSPIGDEGWELWRAASSLTSLEDRHPGKLVHVYSVVAGDVSAFEAAITGRRLPRAAWYRAVGKETGRYLLIVPAESPGSPPPLAKLIGNATARAVRAETWRYAPRLALMPGKPLVR